MVLTCANQVSVIARALVEQLQEERRDEIASLRAAIYSDVKVLVLLSMFDLLVEVSARLHAATLRNLPESMLEGTGTMRGMSSEPINLTSRR